MDILRRFFVAWAVFGVAWAGLAYLPPEETRLGVRVEIGSFPQKIERPAGNPYAWPLGVTEVAAGAPREFPVTVSNTTDAAVCGTLDVWMNDDWTVTGRPSGALTLAAKEGKTLSFTGTAGARALDALYPVHARFTPTGAAADAAPHPIAVFKYNHPNAPRMTPTAGKPVFGKGAFRLDHPSVARTVTVEVDGQRHALPSSGDAGEWGGGMRAGKMFADGVMRQGWNSHPPYRKGAGFVWSDIELTLPNETPIVFTCQNYLVSNFGQPPSDGAEFRMMVLEEGAEAKTVCGQIVTKILTWQELRADLSAWAGKKITLRLWNGPGPKMNTCCDGGGWGDVMLLVGPQPKPPTEADWAARTRAAVRIADEARAKGTDAADGRWRLTAADGTVYGAGVVRGERGLIDGVLAFSDGAKSVAFKGFTATVDTADGGMAPEIVTDIREEKGTLRVAWRLKDVVRDARGFPRFTDLAPGAATERPWRVYAGFGNVLEEPKEFNLVANGFNLSTRHVGADYANGLSVVQAVDVPPDSVMCDGEKNLFALHAHHDAVFTFVPSNKGAFEAARRFRAVSGYRKSPGRDVLGSRMCIDQWRGDYGKAAEALARAAEYGLNDAIFVKHAWQRWGYDYRLPEIYPPHGDAAAFGRMREACQKAGILFCPHDNYTDIYPDAENYSYDLVVFNLDGTPQRAWFNPGRHAQSYRWAPHAFHPWTLRNAKLLKGGYDPEAVFIDVLTAHGPFDYLDRDGKFHSKVETSRMWAKAYETYREGYGRPDAVCVSEAGQDHLIGTLDAGQSDHFTAEKWFGGTDRFKDAERTPWHDIVSHNYFVLFAGGLGDRYQEPRSGVVGDRKRNGYGSDDYLSNTMIGGRNPMCDGPFNADTVKTYWLQHDACAELGAAEFLDLRYEGTIKRQHAFFSDGGEVWVNRSTNSVWKLENGWTLPVYGYYAKTRTTESGIVEKDGHTYAFATSPTARYVEARGVWTDFGGIRTDGAFRIVGDTLIPLPGQKPFRAEIDTADGRTVKITCDGKAATKILH